MILALILNSSAVVSGEIPDKSLANNSGCIGRNKPFHGYFNLLNDIL
jgi:hypothetical protein